MMLSPTNYLAERRYYWPIVPLAVLVAYSIPSVVDISRESRAYRGCSSARAVSIWLDTSR